MQTVHSRLLCCSLMGKLAINLNQMRYACPIISTASLVVCFASTVCLATAIGGVEIRKIYGVGHVWKVYEISLIIADRAPAVEFIIHSAEHEEVVDLTDQF